MIEAIATKYKGYKFRSRTEARWAVFFDEIGIKWEYEVEGYKYGINTYLPDFEIYYDWGEGIKKVFVEIKPPLENPPLTLSEQFEGIRCIDNIKSSFLMKEYRRTQNVSLIAGNEYSECFEHPEDYSKEFLNEIYCKYLYILEFAYQSNENIVLLNGIPNSDYCYLQIKRNMWKNVDISKCFILNENEDGERLLTFQLRCLWWLFNKQIDTIDRACETAINYRFGKIA